MKRSHIEKAIEAGLAADQPIFIEGPPGVGKSSIVRQVAARWAGKDEETACITAPLPEFDVVDIRGLPTIKNGDGSPGYTHWCPPDLFFREGKYVILLDELPNAPTLVQSGALRLVLERRVAERKLPDGARIVAAGNRITDKAGAGRLLSSLADRFFRVEMEPNTDDWVDWALAALPEESTVVIAFIRFRPELLSTFETEKNGGKPFATPRSWEKLARLHPVVSRDIEYEVYKGTVGEGPATEFMAFLKVWRDLPDLDGILLDPHKAKVPEKNPAAMFAIATGLAARVGKDTAENMLIYAKRMPAEFSVLTVRDAMRRNSATLAHSKAFIQWARENQEYMS